jgi:hypothetical protein
MVPKESPTQSLRVSAMFGEVHRKLPQGVQGQACYGRSSLLPRSGRIVLLIEPRALWQGVIGDNVLLDKMA